MFGCLTLVELFIFYLFESSNSVNNNSPCFCDETTAVSVENLPCYYTIQRDKYRFRSGCQCVSGFKNPRLDKNSLLVSCTPTFSDQSPLSVKCFCDQVSAFKTESDGCTALLSANGTVLYESGCQCTNSKAHPAIVQEFFLSRIYVAHCVFKNGTSAYASINNSQKMRNKRQVEDTTLSNELTTTEDWTDEWTTEETTELPTTTLESTTELETTTESSTTEEQTTELSTTEEQTTETTPKTSTPRPTSTSTFKSNVTVPTIILTTTEGNGEINFGACNSTSFVKKDKKTAQILLYVASAWVIIWVIITILVNMYCRSWGHHRFLDFMQEVSLIAAFVFMGFFTLRPDLTGLCKATRLVLQFMLMYFLTNAIMQAFFLNGLIKGRSTKNSCIPWVFNYTLPPLIAGGLTAGFYFWMKDDYEGNDVHCFCEIYTDLFWTFAFPAWIFGFTAVFFNQTSITACKMSRSDVRLDQLFWAKKMCRGLPIFTVWFCMCYFLLLFGIDMQRLWIIGLYMGVCMLFGPIFFVLHTYCYETSAAKLFVKTGVTFYKPCPQKKSEVDESDKNTKVDLRARHPMSDPIVPLKGAPEKADLPPQPVGSLSTMNPPMAGGIGMSGVNPIDYGPLEYDPTSPQDLYNWLTDKNAKNMTDGEDILFKKNV